MLQHQSPEAHQLPKVVRQALELIVLKVKVDDVHQIAARERRRPRKIEQIAEFVPRHEDLRTWRARKRRESVSGHPFPRRPLLSLSLYIKFYIYVPPYPLLLTHIQLPSPSLARFGVIGLRQMNHGGIVSKLNFITF